MLATPWSGVRRISNRRYRRRAARTVSSSSIAGGSGTRAGAAGWAGSGSGASSWSSTGCSGATGARATPGSAASPSSQPRIRFVITLDADTQMPRDSGRRLVGTLAHPLNAPRFDPARGGWSRATASCSRGSASTWRRRRTRGSPRSWRRRGGSTRTRRPLRRLHGPVRPGQLHGQGDLRRRRLRGGDGHDLPREPHPQPRPDRGELRPLRPGSATPSCSTTSRPATTPMPAASTAGSAATGSSCPGSAAGCRRPRAGAPTRCRSWSAGSCSTTSAAASCPRRWSSCWSWAGRSCPARPGSGRRSPWRCRRCRSCR